MKEDIFLTPPTPMSHRGGTPLMPSPEWSVLTTYSYLGCATSLLRWLWKWVGLSHARGQGILYSFSEKGRGPEGVRCYMPYFYSTETRTATIWKNRKLSLLYTSEKRQCWGEKERHQHSNTTPKAAHPLLKTENMLDFSLVIPYFCSFSPSQDLFQCIHW